MKSFLLLSILFFVSSYSLSQINVDNTTFDFGVLNGWNFINGSEPNKWHIGGTESYYDPFSRIGAYLYRLQPSAFFVSKKMILIK